MTMFPKTEGAISFRQSLLGIRTVSQFSSYQLPRYYRGSFAFLQMENEAAQLVA